MKTTMHRTLAGSSLLTALLLSACAPNPTVLQDRVYDRYPQQPPAPAPVAPPPPVARTLPLPQETAPKVEQRPVIKQQPISPSSSSTSSTSVVDVSKPTSTTSATRPSWESPSWESYKPEALNSTTTTSSSTSSAPTSKSYNSSPAVQALVKQADSDIASGKLDSAADTLERALRIESDNPTLWSKLSKINAMQGHTEQAASMASKAQAYQELLH